MIGLAVTLGAFAGGITGVICACVAHVYLANRSDRGLTTGPLPVIPPPDPYPSTDPRDVARVTADVLYGPRSHRAP